ncbi:MAG TPA: carboxypeptidase-like regulatory domain-containing protein, partial [Terriglobia bacterium]|nr:carboxypeptidase-like regulatory domain-containing protein [Terriglobia bacterium]
VEGVVSRNDKSPMAGATVLLIPVDSQMLSMAKTATAGADGKYVFRGVRPGDYKVFGGPPNALPSGAITAELLSSIESRGTSVSIKAGNSVKLDVEAITN